MRRLAVVLAAAVLASAGCPDHSHVTVCSGGPHCFPDDETRLVPGGPALVPLPDGGVILADTASPAIYRFHPFEGFSRVAGDGVAPIGPPRLLGLDSRDGGVVFRELDTMAVRKIGPDGHLETLVPAPFGPR